MTPRGRWRIFELGHNLRWGQPLVRRACRPQQPHRGSRPLMASTFARRRRSTSSTLLGWWAADPNHVSDAMRRTHRPRLLSCFDQTRSERKPQVRQLLTDICWTVGPSGMSLGCVAIVGLPPSPGATGRGGRPAIAWVTPGPRRSDGRFLRTGLDCPGQQALQCSFVPWTDPATGISDGSLYPGDTRDEDTYTV